MNNFLYLFILKMVKKSKVIKKSSQTKDDINITNDINIKIDLEPEEKQKPKKKRTYKKKPKLLDELEKYNNGNVSGISNAPRKLGMTKIPSTDSDFNPNNTTNMIVASAMQNAFQGNRPNFPFAPITPPALPAPIAPPALPAPPIIPAITAPPIIPAITAPPTPPPLPPPPTSGIISIDDLERLGRLYLRNQPVAASNPFTSPQTRFTSVGRRGGILGRPKGSKNKPTPPAPPPP